MERDHRLHPRVRRLRPLLHRSDPPFRMAHRRFSGPEVGATTGVLLHPDRLTLPLRWRKPRRIFVNSLSDLFHADVPDSHIASVFAVMALAPQHTFQLLTKRHTRMRSLLSAPRFTWFVSDAVRKVAMTDQPFKLPAARMDAALKHIEAIDDDEAPMPPLPNVHLGVSVEDQHWADLRLPALLDTPAAVRWISAEPLLGPVNLDPWRCPGDKPNPATPADTRLDWVVCGGESGKGARPIHPQWARQLRDQCAAAGVPFYFKQWGEWLPLNDRPGAVEVEYTRVGKKAAGRDLDGRTHDEFPGDAA